MSTMFEGFLSFAGTEIINVARTYRYVSQEMPTFGLEDCYSCGDLQAALGDGTYESVLVDQPDWFDPQNSDSWRFYGVWPLALDGFEDAVRESTVTQLITDGAAITAPRQQGREMTVSALLIGADDAAISYGLTWLRFALFGALCRDSLTCTGDHLCYFAACPPMCEDSPALADPEQLGAASFMLCDDGVVATGDRACTLPYERTYYEVTVTEGPKIADRYNTACGSMVRVEWTFVAAVPWSYATSVVAATTDGVVPQIVPDVACTLGSTTVRRRNLALNPVPRNAGGWVSGDATHWPATRDATRSRLEGRSSVVTTVAAAIAATNIASNPVPSGALTGWSYAPAGAATTTLGSGAGPNATTSFEHNVVKVAQTNPGSGPTYRLARAVKAGDQYVAQLWVKASAATRVQLVVSVLDAGGDVLWSGQGPFVEPAVGAWTLLGPLQVEVPVAGAALVVRASMDGGVLAQVRHNLAVDPQATSATPKVTGVGGQWIGKWFGGTGYTGTTTAVTGASDGPTTDLKTYLRKAWTAVAAGPYVAGASDVGWSYSGTSNRVPVTAGHTYTISRWFRSSVDSAGGFRNQVYVTGYDDAGTAVGGTFKSDNQAFVAGQWVRSSVTVTVPAGVTWLMCSDSIQMGTNTAVGMTLDETGLMIEEASALGDWFSGNTPSTFDWAYTWDGTANASASTGKSLVAAPLPVGASLDAGSVQILAGAAATTPAVSSLTNVGQTSTAATQITVTPRAVYTGSVYASGSRPIRARATLHWYTAAGVATGAAVVGAWVDVAAYGWDRVVVSGTAPATAARVTMSVEAQVAAGGAAVGDKVWWGDALIELSKTALSYFDGSMPDLSTASEFAWTGTADASISTLSTLVPAPPSSVSDPDCVTVPDPPRPDPIPVTCLDTPVQWVRYEALIPAVVIPVWRDAVPVVRIETEAAAARQVRVRFYPNEFEVPVASLDVCDFCGEFLVSYIPPNSTLTVDGIRRTAYVVAAGDTARMPATHLLYSSDGGPMTWPDLTCGVAYTAVLDVSPDSVVGLTASACLAARE